jgi:hypothetical protein
MAHEKKDESNPLTMDLKDRITKLEVHVSYIKDQVESLNNRTWWILSTVVLSILLAIVLALLK